VRTVTAAAAVPAATARRGRADPVRLGIARGWIELKLSLTYWPDIVQTVVFAGISLLVLFLMRGHHVPGTSFSLGSLTLPSVIGMNLAFTGVLGVTGLLSVDREDGTLLRAKATPRGMQAFVIGKIIFVSCTTLIGLVLLLVVGRLAFHGLSVTAVGWLTMVWVVALSLLATIPLGIMFGSLLPNPRFIPLVMLPFGALTAISGIFYPITHLPGWLQGIGQVFPMYWAGLGMRSALLPPSLASVEIDGSWRHWLVLLVLAAWAVAGLLGAPPVLRRMARRESGSRVAARRERAMLRAT
jgi:ABC-2 type transport system permease protein